MRYRVLQPPHLAKASSSAGLYRQCSNTSRRATPLVCDAGVMTATRRPARVTTIVVPPATEISTAEKHRDASEAVISRRYLRILQSDDDYMRVKSWKIGRASCRERVKWSVVRV